MRHVVWGLMVAALCVPADAVQLRHQRPKKPKKGEPAWTILALELSGPTAARDAEQFAETLRNTPGIRADDVFIRAAGRSARLYYGHYAAPVSRAESKHSIPHALRDDLLMLKQLGDPSGGRYFLRAIPVRMPTEDVGNPEWALSRAKGLYTLQVGVFEPAGEFTQYKEAAAEFCKLLREQGHPSYYHHTDAASMVTVGAFGADALIHPPRDAKPGAIAIPTYHPKIIGMQQNELLKYNLLNGGIQYIRHPDGSRTPVMSRLVEIPGQNHR
jgi:hypothetical protein